jgi:hypothetical protein
MKANESADCAGSCQSSFSTGLYFYTFLFMAPSWEMKL